MIRWYLYTWSPRVSDVSDVQNELSRRGGLGSENGVDEQRSREALPEDPAACAG